MSAKKRIRSSCSDCTAKNVQVVLFDQPVGQNSPRLFLRIASGHNATALCEFLSKCSEKCPSGSRICPSGFEISTGICPSGFSEKCPSGFLNLEGYVMEKEVQVLWLPLARVAALYGKSVKTIRRMVADGSFIAVKRIVESGSYRISKLFIISGQELVDRDKAYCRKRGEQPVYLQKERIRLEGCQPGSLFVISYSKDKKVEHGQD
ncbi:MAG: hypothetical protein RBS43_04895 [Candidatus Cloacimonas sp.]|nr:hypothetical protein [Candidatus Cloacimonas sp.]